MRPAPKVPAAAPAPAVDDKSTGDAEDSKPFQNFWKGSRQRKGKKFGDMAKAKAKADGAARRVSFR